MTRWRKAGRFGRHVATSLQLLHLLHANSMGRASPEICHANSPFTGWRACRILNSQESAHVKQPLPPLVVEPPHPPSQASR
ncbi:hypothetical protein M441DRAFT_84174 [Trichoderma asperellum CBS 433.97]|uniref:Secreted protein n=1 Tax=Trichoderma asperellum (strain ATCC 204424 / CBS 433.97 / NBRC 101777) TaxID=1042311 RepID=A0A2T3YTU1_TRIA4|nr:hypothetical protein M441DRAFT_84174 [Trichoderma asperellum CBS 433.97]PTB35957.1 hypothetical protein M441DRAFT_84174 [Trichoderma asperellum CBS 433.97]